MLKEQRIRKKYLNNIRFLANKFLKARNFVPPDTAKKKTTQLWDKNVNFYFELISYYMSLYRDKQRHVSTVHTH